MQQSNRYDLMFNYVCELIKAKEQSDFSIEERNLICTSFKVLVSGMRRSLNLVADIIHNEKFANFVPVLSAFRLKLQEELVAKCQEITDLLDRYCLPLCANSESRIFFLKLTGDYNRYAAESFSTAENVTDTTRFDYTHHIDRAQAVYLSGLK